MYAAMIGYTNTRVLENCISRDVMKQKTDENIRDVHKTDDETETIYYILHSNVYRYIVFLTTRTDLAIRSNVRPMRAVFVTFCVFPDMPRLCI